MPHTPLRIAFARPWPGTRRGLKLWFLSIIIGLKGIGYALGSVTAVTQAALQVFTQLLHIPIGAVACAIVGLCLGAGWCAYCHHGRDRWGYAALTGFCGVWTIAYATSPVFFGAPVDALQGALSWSAIGVFLLLCSGDKPGEPLAPGSWSVSGIWQWLRGTA